MQRARRVLGLPSGLRMNRTDAGFGPANYNYDAMAGPFLEARGIKTKEGLYEVLRNTSRTLLEMVGRGELEAESLPFFTCKLAYRTKLRSMDETLEKIRDGKPLGRAAMALDALEQFICQPVFKVFDEWTAGQANIAQSPWKNKGVRQSAQRRKLSAGFVDASVIYEADWSAYDVNRPDRDIAFGIRLILSCFEARSEEERRILDAVGLMMHRGLCDKVICYRGGGIARFKDGVPSGSLWTSIIDTIMNILYIAYVCDEIGLIYGVDCYCITCGDDLLLYCYTERAVGLGEAFRTRLNEWFGAGIRPENFFVHHPPFFVTKVQYVYPAGVKLDRGTSHLSHLAVKVPFKGRITVDEKAGRSHRWEYRFAGHPKFLGCYWLDNGMPIRPTADLHRRALFPEGIVKDLDEYKMQCYSYIVDNPFNEHTVNHMMHRICIARQLKIFLASGFTMSEAYMLLTVRETDEVKDIPFPRIASWRRGRKYMNMEQMPECSDIMRKLTKFVEKIQLMYGREAEGGGDVYQIKKAIRGEGIVSRLQYGSSFQRVPRRCAQ
eukprot:GHVR01053125.1.p1 GENE.GHVR01053125.1~~GHVR01053125.1.p1  ORF type:complete len:550 (-),score=44.02 GHVR01053125.1:354-2003(-)